MPATEADTKIMCEIVGCPYSDTRPTSSQKTQIINDNANSNATYTWPDFNNTWGNGKDIGSKWDRRAALINVGGKVYPVSIYGYPHGYLGTSRGVGAMRLGGESCCDYNNYYGVMCIHFVNSTTHSNNLDSDHQANIKKAYEYAKKTWPSLCK